MPWSCPPSRPLRHARRALLLVLLVAGTLALGACTERDTNNPFAARNGDNEAAPFGDGAQASEPTPPAEPDH